MTPPSRIMYIEFKGDDVSGPARIGRVTYSRSGKSISYRGQEFQKLQSRGFKANYFDRATMERYWISGCKKKGEDRLYPGIVEIDADAREEYWTEIRGMPESKAQAMIRCKGKYGGGKK